MDSDVARKERTKLLVVVGMDDHHQEIARRILELQESALGIDVVDIETFNANPKEHTADHYMAAVDHRITADNIGEHIDACSRQIECQVPALDTATLMEFTKAHEHDMTYSVIDVVRAPREPRRRFPVPPKKITKLGSHYNKPRRR